MTLTARHGPRDRLSDLKELVSGASRKARGGAPWKRLAERHSIENVINGPEVTISRKFGWHFHQHLAVIVSSDDQTVAEAAGYALLERYMAMIEAAGGKALPQAQDVQVVWRKEDVQSYLAKGSAAWEVASAGVGKDARGDSLTPWDLAAAAAAGDAWARARFLEYVDEMPGTRSCVITAAIAAKLGISADEGEGELQEEEVDEDVGTIDRDTWHLLLRRGRVPDLLDAVDRGLPWGQIEAEIEVWSGREPDRWY